jgi:hypothetical protein
MIHSLLDELSLIFGSAAGTGRRQLVVGRPAWIAKDVLDGGGLALGAKDRRLLVARL